MLQHDDGPRPGQQIIDVILPTYRMAPDEDEVFYPSIAKGIIEKVLHAQVQDFVWDEDVQKEFILSVSDAIKNRIKAEMRIPRYKVIVQVSMGQMNDQAVSIASQCLWNRGTDNYAAASFTNETFWCNALVFGIYTD
ncbi:Tctex-1 family-domain-containing protein [Pelagophyceae sp. CCMP2097]|nr:Tctex-1 family-domain-containing protein [Pelagophyceae sp. CCMP2097]